MVGADSADEGAQVLLDRVRLVGVLHDRHDRASRAPLQDAVWRLDLLSIDPEPHAALVVGAGELTVPEFRPGERWLDGDLAADTGVVAHQLCTPGRPSWAASAPSAACCSCSVPSAACSPSVSCSRAGGASAMSRASSSRTTLPRSQSTRIVRSSARSPMTKSAEAGR